MLSNYYDNIKPVDLNPLIVYQLYNSIKLHFSQKNYDYLKYKLNEKRFTLESLNQRPDKEYFKKLSEKVMYRNRLIPLLVSNFYYNNKIWVGDLLQDDSLKKTIEYRKYQNTFTDSFVDDIKKLVYNSGIISSKQLHSDNIKTNYFTLLAKKKIHPITGSILDNLYYTKYIHNSSLSFIYSDTHFTLSRYHQFIANDAVKSISEDLITEIINQNKLYI